MRRVTAPQRAEHLSASGGAGDGRRADWLQRGRRTPKLPCGGAGMCWEIQRRQQQRRQPSWRDLLRAEHLAFAHTGGTAADSEIFEHDGQCFYNSPGLTAPQPAAPGAIAGGAGRRVFGLGRRLAAIHRRPAGATPHHPCATTTPAGCRNTDMHTGNLSFLHNDPHPLNSPPPTTCRPWPGPQPPRRYARQHPAPRKQLGDAGNLGGDGSGWRLGWGGESVASKDEQLTQETPKCRAKPPLPRNKKATAQGVTPRILVESAGLTAIAPRTTTMHGRGSHLRKKRTVSGGSRVYSLIRHVRAIFDHKWVSQKVSHAHRATMRTRSLVFHPGHCLALAVVWIQ